MRKIALIHAAEAAINKMNKTFNSQYKVYNIFDDGLQELFLEKEHDKIISRIKNHISSCIQDYGIQATVITCTAYNLQYQRVIENLFDIPILKVDVPMMERALMLGPKICIISTFKPGGEAAMELLKELADQKKLPIHASEIHVKDAFQALKEGMQEKHDLLVKEAVLKTGNRYDACVLSQVSMAHLAETLQQQLNVSVLSSPKECLTKLESMFYERQL